LGVLLDIKDPDKFEGWERTKEDLKEEQDSIEEVAKWLSWKKVVEKGDLAVWRW
jgi:hypothetical protein